MDITHTSTEKAEIITLDGDLDSITSIYFKEVMTRVYATGNFRVVIDVNAVTHIDSAGLSQLITAFKMCKHQGGGIVLAGSNKVMIDLLRITRLDLVLTIHDDIDTAIASFGS